MDAVEDGDFGFPELAVVGLPPGHIHLPREHRDLHLRVRPVQADPEDLEALRVEIVVGTRPPGWGRAGAAGSTAIPSSAYRSDDAAAGPDPGTVNLVPHC